MNQRPRRLDTAEHRKARGAFFTPPELCRFVADWAIRAPSDDVLEPSCGEAAFLLAAGHRLRSLGAAGPSLRDRLAGVELHDGSAGFAYALLRAHDLDGRVDIGDFFDVASEPRYDAVIGNPPYVRYQEFSGAARAKAQQAALVHGVRLSGLASSWAAFVVHASQFLSPVGRLGLVLPAELLSVNYAADVRKFLLNRFASVRLVLFEERVFPGVSEEVVLLLAEGTGPTSHLEVFQTRDLSDLSALTAGPWTVTPADSDGWLSALVPEDTFSRFKDLVVTQGLVELGHWGDPNLGIVTGNNDFFALSPTEAKVLGLRSSELLPISPPGSRHLRGLSITEARWRALGNDGSKTHLFYPNIKQPSKAARAYVRAGEKRGVHTAYKCRVRHPWWRLPLTPAPDFFLTYMNHDAPRLVANPSKLRHVNSVHGVVLAQGRHRKLAPLLPIAFLNSATLLGAELMGRSYGGGILKVEPKEAERLPFPSEELIHRSADDLRAARTDVARYLREGDLDRAILGVDHALFGESGAAAETARVLRGARRALFKRRSARKG